MKESYKKMEIIRKCLESPLSDILLAFLSTVFFALADFMAQVVQLSSNNFPLLEVVYVSAIICFVLLTPSFLYSNAQILFPREKWMILIGIGLPSFLCCVLKYASLSLIPMASMMTLSATCPFFGIFFSYLLLRDKCFWQDGISGLLSFIGVLLIARPEMIFGKYGKKVKVFYQNISDNKYEFLYLSGCAFAALFGAIRALFLVITRKWKDENPVLVLQ